MRKGLMLVLFVCMYLGVTAQHERFVREGNKLYQEKKYKEADASYQKALQKNPSYVPGIFNLGNSLYQQNKFDQSRKVLDAALKNVKDKDGKAGVNYNIGNTYMAEKKWEEAIAAYKKTLRNNPRDADAKYNLSYAQAMLKKEQGGGGKDKNKDNKDKNDKNKDQQNKDNQDKKDDNKDKGDKDDKNKDEQNKDKQDKGDKGDKEDKQDERPQPQPSKLSQQQAEQLLNALQQEEKKLQEKKQKEKGIPVKTDKDW